MAFNGGMNENGSGFSGGTGGSGGFGGGFGQGYEGSTQGSEEGGGGWGIGTNPLASTDIAVDQSNLSNLSVEEAKQNKNELTGGQSGGWDWGGFLQGLALGFEIAGIPGAGAGAIIGGTHNMVDFSSTPNSPAQQQGANKKGSEGGGGQGFASLNLNANQQQETTQQNQSTVQTGEGSQASPTDEANKAEEKERRRGFGYLEAMTGETDITLSSLWNPNISMVRRPTFY